MRRPDLVADFESWLYGDDNGYERPDWFVSFRCDSGAASSIATIHNVARN